MTILDELAKAGVLTGEDIPGPMLVALKERLRLNPPGQRFEDKELRIQMRGDVFAVYDFDGFLLGTSSPEMLLAVLMLQAIPNSSARLKLFPEQRRSRATISELDENFAAIQERVRRMKQNVMVHREETGGVRGTPGQGDEMGDTSGFTGVVRQVGVTDGPPRFDED